MMNPTMLLLVVVAASFGALSCNAQLATTVVSGYTVCANKPECNVPGGGSTLAVATMTGNAKTAGNATATFKTQGTQFSGKLTVDCLTTDPWTNGVSLAVEIRDGARVVGTVIPTVLEIKGVLSLGSSILIINGTYDFNAVFLVVTYFGLKDGSTLVVTGMQFVYTTVPDSVMRSSEPLSIDNESRIEISHTSHSFSSLTRGNAWAWYVFNAVSSITISLSSEVALIGNSFTMKSVTSPVCDMGMMSIASMPLAVSSRSTIMISGNSIDLASHTASSGAFSVKMLTQSLATNLSSDATMKVMNNKVNAVSVTASLIATFVSVDTLALNADASTVTVSGNSYNVSTLTAAGIVVAFLRPTNYLTTASTVVDVSGNAFIRSNVVVSSPTQSSVALVGGVSTGGINVHTNSRLRINRNSITDGPLTSSAFNNVRFVVAGGLTQTGGGTIDLANNGVVFATQIDTLFTLTTNNATIAVCGNSLNNLPCRPVSGGLYSCAASGATNVVFTACSKTYTISIDPNAPTTTAPGGSTTAPGGSTTAPGGTNTSTTTASPGSSSTGAYTSLVGAALAMVIGCLMTVM